MSEVKRSDGRGDGQSDERSESRKGLGRGTRIIVVIMGVGGCTEVRARVVFVVRNGIFARCFDPRPISPPPPMTEGLW